MDLRKIDALVAEHVFGLKVEERVTYGANSADVTVYTIGDVTDPKPYSSDIAAAWEVVEKMGALHFKLEQRGEAGTNWWCRMHPGQGAHGHGEAETAPLAISLAALRAKGIAVD